MFLFSYSHGSSIVSAHQRRAGCTHTIPEHIPRQTPFHPWLLVGFLVRTLWEGTGCSCRRDHAELGQHFSVTNVLVLAPGDQHNTKQCKNSLRSGHGLWGMHCAGKLMCMKSKNFISKAGDTYLSNASKPGRMCIPVDWHCWAFSFFLSPSIIHIFLLLFPLPKPGYWSNAGELFSSLSFSLFHSVIHIFLSLLFLPKPMHLYQEIGNQHINFHAKCLTES